MEYCKKCLTTSLRPNSNFAVGLCIACRFSETSADERVSRKYWLDEIRSIIRAKRRMKQRTAYDCIVGVSGGKDSLRQALWVRDKLEVNPLLVCVGYPPLQMSETGAQNLSNIIEQGFDLINIQPAPNTSRILTKRSFLKFGNLCKATELALHSGVPRIALKKGIRTILWGENPALQVGDAGVQGKSPIDGSQHRNLNTLTAGGLDWLNIKPHNLHWYSYPTKSEFESRRLDMFYLGPIWEDWAALNNATYSAFNGLNFSKFSGEYTGDILQASMLDEDFTNINMMLKYYKFGFGRATDAVNESIRLGVLSRDAAIEIVKKYDGICDEQIITDFCNYIGINRDEFWKVVHEYTNTNIFEICSNTLRPVPKFEVGVNFKE